MGEVLIVSLSITITITSESPSGFSFTGDTTMSRDSVKDAVSTLAIISVRGPILEENYNVIRSRNFITWI